MMCSSNKPVSFLEFVRSPKFLGVKDKKVIHQIAKLTPQQVSKIVGLVRVIGKGCK